MAVSVDIAGVLHDVSQAVVLCVFAYVRTTMARKQRITMSLSQDVVERLDEKDNKSGFVDKMLKEEFDL